MASRHGTSPVCLSRCDVRSLQTARIASKSKYTDRSVLCQSSRPVPYQYVSSGYVMANGHNSARLGMGLDSDGGASVACLRDRRLTLGCHAQVRCVAC